MYMQTEKISIIALCLSYRPPCQMAHNSRQMDRVVRLGEKAPIRVLFAANDALKFGFGAL